MDLGRKKFTTEFAGRELSLEFSKIGEQANMAVLAKYGETIVLATIVMGRKDKEGIDYFPLTINYEEKFYAAGKIIGSRFVRREGKSSDEAVLSGRLIDRTMRPLFNQAMRRDVQVVTTILSFDEENDPDFVALMAASVATACSQVPWNGPVAGLKIAKIKGGDILINPKMSELKDKELEFDSFVSGRKDQINMIELGGMDAQEKDIVKAFDSAQKEINKLIDFEEKIIKEMGKPKAEVKLVEPDKELGEKISAFLDGKLEKEMYNSDKTERALGLAKLKDELKAKLAEEGVGEDKWHAAEIFFDTCLDNLIHKKILEQDARPDGRKLDEVRDLHAEVKLFERTHGSALFVRGNTQSLAITTIAPPGSEQLIETMEHSGKKRFLLHYNFPPFSVGEVGPFRGPGRRDIGHGALAEKALKGMIPSADEFPYVIRLVSEILSSNGSSSMATVCAGCLSLMDAGVPIKKHVAGIAMGLIMDEKGKEIKILTDIQGPEDHFGDMDFKIAGTKDGINAMQMDVKVFGVEVDVLEKVIKQARKAHEHIIGVMEKALPEARKEVSKYAPVVLTIMIDPEKIGEVIGPGGKVINGIIAATGALTIDIEQTGKVSIAGASKEIAEAAFNMVKGIVTDIEIGQIVEGPVVKILDFGAIVEFAPGKDGMIHVSELKEGFVKKVEDVVKLGDVVRAKVIKAENGKIGLSLKAMKNELQK
ncbi:MAG: polyribonucleotide nucleotidyltransferase [Candidatus Pacebacteria bacterium]|nr:polyribonucleotide nucleotidyltransferase [Candidatus Paceibacterota bacterium]